MAHCTVFNDMRNTSVTKLFGIPTPYTDGPLAAKDHPLELKRFRPIGVGYGVSAKLIRPGTIPDQENWIAAHFEIRVLKKLLNRRVSWHDLVALAQGKSLRTASPIPSSEGSHSGTLRLLWWLGDRIYDKEVYPDPCFEFIPDNSLPEEIGFGEWCAIRYPETSTCCEYKFIWCHRKWMEETNPDLNHRSNQELLKKSIRDNQANIVVYLLSLGLSGNHLTGGWDGSQLGIAMENTGRLSCGFDQYREGKDPIVDELDGPDWVPQADRIVAALKAAGAQDYSALPLAAMNGDLPEVKRLLAMGYPVDFSTYSHPPALYSAVKQRNLEMVQVLLAAGADPNSKWGSILMAAIDAKDSCDEVVRKILRSLMDAGVSLMNCTLGHRDSGYLVGARIPYHPDIFFAFPGRDVIDEEIAEILFGGVQKFERVRDLEGRTLLHSWGSYELTACQRWIPEEVINEHDLNFETPLFTALLRNNDEGDRMIDFLLAAGADPDLPCIAGMAKMDGSLGTVDKTRLQVLMEDSWTHEKEPIGWESFLMLTAIQAAAIMGRFDLVWKMREKSKSKSPATSVTIFRRPKKLLPGHRYRIRHNIAKSTEWPTLDHVMGRDPYYFGFDTTDTGFHGLQPQEYYRFLHLLLSNPQARNDYPEFCTKHQLFKDSTLYPPEGLLCWSFTQNRISVSPCLSWSWGSRFAGILS